MTLAQYLFLIDESDATFATRIGRSRKQVWAWRTGRARPDWASLDLILAATGQQVAPSDFAMVNVDA